MNTGVKKREILAMLLITVASTGCFNDVPTQTESYATLEQLMVVEDSETPAQELPPADSDTPEASTDPYVDWQTYANENYQISIRFPPLWFGPDVYEVDNEVRIAIGSDTVYPYGTDRTEQTYTVKDSYTITIQYKKNPGYQTLEEYSQAQPWLDTYMSLLNLKDGESISDARALVKRVGEVEAGEFRGLEYIATLSETAQTEPFFARQTILFDEHLNVLVVMGSPNNVDILAGGNWREAYQNVDQENLPTYEKVLEFIIVE